MTNELEMDVQIPKDDNSEPLEVGACDWISCFLTHVGPINFPLQVDKWLVTRLSAPSTQTRFRLKTRTF